MIPLALHSLSATTAPVPATSGGIATPPNGFSIAMNVALTNAVPQAPAPSAGLTFTPEPPLAGSALFVASTPPATPPLPQPARPEATSTPRLAAATEIAALPLLAPPADPATPLTGTAQPAPLSGGELPVLRTVGTPPVPVTPAAGLAQPRAPATAQPQPSPATAGTAPLPEPAGTRSPAAVRADAPEGAVPDPGEPVSGEATDTAGTAAATAATLPTPADTTVKSAPPLPEATAASPVAGVAPTGGLPLPILASPAARPQPAGSPPSSSRRPAERKVSAATTEAPATTTGAPAAVAPLAATSLPAAQPEGKPRSNEATSSGTLDSGIVVSTPVSAHGFAALPDHPADTAKPATGNTIPPSFAERLAGADDAAAFVRAPAPDPATVAAAPAPALPPVASPGLPAPLATLTSAAHAPPAVTARVGHIGREMGVEIARTVADGSSQLTIRLDPVEMGKIEVKLSFDERGSLRAVVAAESPAALDLLRRDTADLTRSLTDAGVRADAQSFRFDSRSGSSDGGQFWQRQQQSGGQQNQSGRGYPGNAVPPEEPLYRSVRTSGRVDLMA